MLTLSRLVPRSAALAACALAAALLAPAPAASQTCASTADAAGCPFRCVGSTDLTGAKPTPLGNSICETVGNLAAIAEQIGAQAATYVQPAQQDLQALVSVTLQGAVNPGAIQTYNTALQRTEVIGGRIDDFMGDPVCGSEAALNQLKQFFTDQAGNLVAAGQIAGSTAQAVAALAPALTEVNKIIQQLGQIAATVQTHGPEAQKQYDILMGAMQELKSKLEELAALDVPGTVVAGAEMVGSVGPFLTNCAGCTSALVGAVGSLGTGTGVATGSGAACPETVELFGGSCWGILGLPAGLAASGVVGALASPPCAAAAEGVGQMADHLEKISTFVTTSANLASGIAESVSSLMTASQALIRLAEEVGSEMEPQLQSIATSLNATADAINASSGILATQVAPKVAALAGDVVQQIGGNVVTMATCYNKLHTLAAAIGGDVLNGVNDLVVATAHLVDGGQVMTNIATQGQSAMQATASHATSGFSALSSERNRIHNALWGVNWPTVPPLSPSTFAHLAGFASPLASPSLLDLGQDIVALEAAQAAVIPNALAAGNAAFLTAQSAQGEARDEFDLAGSLAQSALSKLNNPGTPPVTAMAVPPSGSYTGSFPTVDLGEIASGPKAPRTTLKVVSSRDLLTTHLREIAQLEFSVRYPSGRQPTGGTACLSCPRDYAMAPVWRSMEQARVRDPVTIRVYNGRTLVADLGTHSPSRGGWSSLPASLTVAPQARTSDPASGCGYRMVVTDSRGRPLGETETCLQRR